MVDPSRGTHSIGVLRALPGVGDLLCAVPALRALRAAHPAATITLFGLPSAAWFVDRLGDLVDDLLIVEGVGGLPEVAPSPDAAARFVRRARDRRFDLVVQIHGSGAVTNRLIASLDAGRVASACLPGQWSPPGAVVEYRRDVPEIERMLAVVAAAGCPPAGRDLELPVTEDEQREAADQLDRAGLRGRAFACVHPGASGPDRRWPAASFARIGDDLAARGLPVVLTGSAGEAELVSSTALAMHTPAIDLAGRTGLGVLAALYRRASLVVTNDTGASHVAAAVRTPSVVVSGSAEPFRWAPLDRARHRMVTGDAPPSWPSVGAVLLAVDDQLRRWTPAAAPAAEHASPVP